MSEPASEKIDAFYTKDKSHYVTVAKWTGEFGPSYEVGLRDCKTNEFTLAASYLPTEAKARAAGKAIGKLAEAGESLEDIEKAFPGLFDGLIADELKKWYGRIGYDREGIVREKTFKTKEEAKAYELGALDMKEQSDISEDGVLEDYWAVASDLPSIDG